MNHQERNERGGVMLRFRATMHIAMGVLYLVLGVSIIYMKAFGTLDLDPPWPYVVGGLMMLYGAFRLWRGMADLKLRKRGLN